MLFIQRNTRSRSLLGKDMYSNGMYLKNNPEWHEADSPWKAQKVINMLDNNNLSPMSICDIGCGSGAVLEYLLNNYNQNIRYTGYDLSPDAIDICVENRDERIVFEIKELDDIREMFDLVLVLDVIEHVEDYMEFCKQVSVKSEYKIFHIPLDISVNTLFRPGMLLGKRKHVGHLHYFTKEIALELVKDSGMEVVDYFYTAGGVELAGKGWKARIVGHLRNILFRINKDIAARLLGGFSLLVLAR